jgi:Zn-dependent M28 family amino/carboxypeptidase
MKQHFLISWKPFYILLVGLFLFTPALSFAQANKGKKTSTVSVKATRTAKSEPAAFTTESVCKAHLQFLADDRLLGRMTGSAGNDTAAAYIARHFKAQGLEPLGDASSANPYLQRVPFVRVIPPKGSLLRFGNQKDSTMVSIAESDVYTLYSIAMNGSVDAVYAGFGVVDSAQGRDDYKGLDVKGKFVVVKFGLNDSASLRQNAGWVVRKRQAAAARGAKGVIECLAGINLMAWSTIGQFMATPRPQLASAFENNAAAQLPSFLVKDADNKILSRFAKNPAQSVSITSAATNVERIYSNNVLALLRGSDPKLRDEYVLLSAHHDHIGTAGRSGMQDSIYNGARDNGMGTTAVLEAASILAQKPPARSIIFATWTAEEVGLLGSEYYSEHPAIPLEKVVYNLNTDGAGFNDTTLVTVIGFDRTSAEPLLQKAAATQGLKAVSDPAPEQNLFDRSDNVRFAAKGIPAPTFSPGFTAFDAEIQKYYHQLADEAGESFHFRYLTRYVNAFIESARLIANAPERPTWKVGDKYEAAFKKLYGKN